MAAGQYGGRPPKVKCAPPGADERIAMFGTFHRYSHTISTSSSSAQKLVNQASFPHIAGLTSTHRGVGLRILFALDSETDAEHTGHWCIYNFDAAHKEADSAEAEGQYRDINITI